jgi:hypothetical protein
MAAYTALARYLLNEASSGTTPTTAADDTGGGNGCSITYNSGATWTSIASGNGIDLTATENTAGSTLIRTTATAGSLGAGLSGATEAAALVVCAIDTYGGGSHLFHIGSSGGDGVFRMSTVDQYQIEVAFASEDSGGGTLYNRATFSSAGMTSGTKRFRVQVDTAQAVQANRCRMWAEDTELTQSGISNFAQNEAIITLTGSHYITLGNAPGNSANLNGKLYYVEVGSGTMTSGQGTSADTALASNNDADWAAAGGSNANLLAGKLGGLLVGKL